jgi:hypothetical protein
VGDRHLAEAGLRTLWRALVVRQALRRPEGSIAKAQSAKGKDANRARSGLIFRWRFGVLAIHLRESTFAA